MQYIKASDTIETYPGLTPRNFLMIAAALSLFGIALAAALPFVG